MVLHVLQEVARKKKTKVGLEKGSHAMVEGHAEFWESGGSNVNGSGAYFSK